VLKQGDDVIAELEDPESGEAVDGATFNGFGFAGSVTFGFFDYELKDCVPKEFHCLEMAALQGSMAWKDGKPSIHMHGVGAGDDYKAVGGHILGLRVGRGWIELTITVSGMRLSRGHDEAIGANVLQLG
jgi:predicted DNA-binding protein with PD1-like motif